MKNGMGWFLMITDGSWGRRKKPPDTGGSPGVGLHVVSRQMSGHPQFEGWHTPTQGAMSKHAKKLQR